MALPDPGDLLWGIPLNEYVLMVESKADAVTSSLASHTGASDPHNVLPTAAADATSKVAAHTAAVDPHGDRGYADGAFVKLTGTSLGAAILRPSAIGNIALVVRAIASQTANTFEVQESGGGPRVWVQPGGAMFVSHNFYSSGNTQLASSSQQWGSGTGVVGLGNASVVPTTNPAAGVTIYAEGGVLKARTQSGTIQQIAPFAAAGAGVPLAGGGVIQSSGTSVVGLTIQAITSQTADLLKLIDVAAADKLRFKADYTLEQAENIIIGKSVQVGGLSNTWGGAVGALGLTNAATPPGSNPSGGVVAYSEAGVFKVRTPTGITTLAPTPALVSVDARRAAVTNVAAATNYDVILTSVSWENPGTWWTSGQNVTVPQAGKYLATVKAVCQSGGTNGGTRFLYLMDYNGGGTPVILSETSMTAPGGGSTDWLVVVLSDVVSLTASQQLFMRVRHTNSEATNIEQMRLTLTYLGT